LAVSSAACALNIYLFGRKLQRAAKFVFTGVISLTAVMAYLLLARVIMTAIFTEGQADRELQILPAYIALKKVDPDSYNKLLEKIVQLRSQRRPQAEIQTAASNVLTEVPDPDGPAAGKADSVGRIRVLRLLMAERRQPEKDARPLAGLGRRGPWVGQGQLRSCMDGARGARGIWLSAKRSGAVMYPASECGRFGRWP
jgi:hypothetical protein